MFVTEEPAVNEDGSLKEPWEIDFVNSPSDEIVPLPPLDSADNPVASTPNDSGKMVAGLKGKEPAHRVGSKRVSKPSAKVTEARQQQLSPKTQRFFSSRFEVGANASNQTSVTTSTEADPTNIPAANPKKRKGAKTSQQSSQHEKRPRTASSSVSSQQVPDGTRERASNSAPNDAYHDLDDDGLYAEDSGDQDSDNDDAGESETAARTTVDIDEIHAEYKQLVEDRKAESQKKKRREHNHRGQDERTRDIRATFKKATRLTADGEHEEGHTCNCCGGFFTGGTSTLRKHIQRFFDSHGKNYLEKCKELEIEPVPAALPQKKETPKTVAPQNDLNGYVISTPKWSKEGLLEHIIEFVVSDDQPFRIVDKEPFRALLKYQRPSTKDSDIPHRTKLTEEIMKKAEAAMDRMKDHFKSIPGRISITFDAWTSKSYDPFLAITAHYIDAPEDKPCDWTLTSKILAFEQLTGRHSGENMAATISQVLDQYEISDKLGWATADNATANDKTLRVLDKKLNGDNFFLRKWKARDRRVRCMEHTIYLAAGDFVQALGPKTKSWTRNRQASVEDYDEEEDGAGDDEDIDDDAWAADWNQLELLEDDEAVDDIIDFEPGDTLGKTLALVNQIRASPQAKEFFRKCCDEEGIPKLELLKWVRTRWGSMYDLIERVLSCRKAVSKFCYLADDNLPKLKNKFYSDYKLEQQEWLSLGLIREVLQEPRRAQASFSSETEPTLWKAIPILECLRSRWNALYNERKFEPVKAAIAKGLQKLDKWYENVKENHTYFTCLVLHPGFKLEYCKDSWDKELFDKSYSKFEEIFDSYYKVPKKAPEVKSATTFQSKEPAPDFGYGSNFILAKLKKSTSFQQEARHDPRKELRSYLESPLELQVSDDPVKWWGYHSQQYPTLSAMARDYLAIQGSSVASERAFSSAGITDEIRRNRTEASKFGKLQILKYAYETNFLKGSIEANAHAPYEVVLVDDRVPT